MGKWRVWNWGNTRSFPFKKGKMIEIPKHSGIETNDRGVAERLSGYPYIEVTEILEEMSVPKLRKLASQKGIKNYAKFNKKELIKQLSEVNNK